MRKFVVLLVIGILSMSLFSLEYGENPKKEISHTYWEAVKNNDIKMTDEEYIENYTKVLPISGTIVFYATNKLDDVYYGGFGLDFNGDNIRSMKAGDPIVSEKNIKDGLYNNKYPMVKTESGRKDIKYFWHPAANCSWCVFYKFSIDDFTSDWVSILGISKSAPKKSVWQDYGGLEKYIEANLKNPDANTFKIEGIRVIYNCDYDMLMSNMHEAYRFVNGDKKSAPTLVAAGAKIMDLKDSVFDMFQYKYCNTEKQEKDIFTYTSYDKLDFEDKMTAKVHDNKIKEETVKQFREKISEAKRNVDYYVGKKDRSSLENLAKEIQESDLDDREKNSLIRESQSILDYYDELFQMMYPSKKQKMKKYFGM